MTTFAEADQRLAPLDGATTDVQGMARLWGVSDKTIRRMLTAGELRGVIRRGRLLRFHVATALKQLEEMASR